MLLLGMLLQVVLPAAVTLVQTMLLLYCWQAAPQPDKIPC
jgi:hypothetical protein